jgi:hypothetical protein
MCSCSIRSTNFAPDYSRVTVDGGLENSLQRQKIGGPSNLCRPENRDEELSALKQAFVRDGHRAALSVRYAIRIGIAREQWRVAIHIPGKGLPEERTVFGTRGDAEATARSMINAWLKKRDEAAQGNAAKPPELRG